MDRYNRNRIYVSEEEQEKVRETRILLGGAGIGSIIAECALRFGFENIVIVDGDRVELSNLNRQNYVKSDIGKSKADIPFVFDDLCSKRKIPVLHPYNFGWGAFLTIVKPGGYQLTEVSPSYKGFEVKMADFVARYCTFWNMPNRWLDDVIETYRNEPGELPPPQLSVASWIVAGHCVNAMFDIITGKEVKYFPKFYFSSLRCDPA